tara:strand:- start:268 stop:645 length:378 start_codon:yes stop_codon:yes gene_type:complete
MVAPQRKRLLTCSRIVVVFASPTELKKSTISVRNLRVLLIKPHLCYFLLCELIHGWSMNKQVPAYSFQVCGLVATQQQQNGMGFCRWGGRIWWSVCYSKLRSLTQIEFQSSHQSITFLHDVSNYS